MPFNALFPMQGARALFSQDLPLRGRNMTREIRLTYRLLKFFGERLHVLLAKEGG